MHWPASSHRSDPYLAGAERPSAAWLRCAAGAAGPRWRPLNRGPRARQAHKDEGNLKFEVSESDDHTFRIDERWTSKRTMFKCAICRARVGHPKPRTLQASQRAAFARRSGTCLWMKA